MSVTMLYKAPGPHHIHGGKFDHVVVPDEEVETQLAEGWFRTTTEALGAYRASSAPIPAAADAPPTRTELEQKATELGIKFDGRTPDKKLAEQIAAKV